ncbi:MAG: arsenate reductase ArsC [Rhodocyclaceae bacterium]|nr:arsenate reductase ArsC [Rhodocyclaceae bacterium]
MGRTFNVLVLCTGNSARSILGEMLFNHLGAGRIRACSAGSQPTGQVNPLALETLERHGVPLQEARSKSWNEFGAQAGQDAVPPAPTFDFIFTVCGSAARETCPVWPGDPVSIHWEIADPSHVELLEPRRAAFEATYQLLRKRIKAFLTLPLETMSGNAVLAATRRISGCD